MYFHVIMPLSLDKEAAIKKEILRTSAKRFGISVILPEDQTISKQFLINDLISSLNNSLFILADLSYERPSCYFELGVSEALKKLILRIAKTDTKIHQTSQQEEVKFYNNLTQYEVLVSEFIEKQIKSID